MFRAFPRDGPNLGRFRGKSKPGALNGIFEAAKKGRQYTAGFGGASAPPRAGAQYYGRYAVARGAAAPRGPTPGPGGSCFPHGSLWAGAALRPPRWAKRLVFMDGRGNFPQHNSLPRGPGCDPGRRWAPGTTSISAVYQAFWVPGFAARARRSAFLGALEPRRYQTVGQLLLPRGSTAVALTCAGFGMTVTPCSERCWPAALSFRAAGAVELSRGDWLGAALVADTPLRTRRVGLGLCQGPYPALARSHKLGLASYLKAHPPGAGALADGWARRLVGLSPAAAVVQRLLRWKPWVPVILGHSWMYHQSGWRRPEGTWAGARRAEGGFWLEESGPRRA